MNTHWLIVLTELIALTGLVILFSFYTITPARAQFGAAGSAGAPPPAFAIARRLLTQGKAQEAIASLHDVESSSTYRNTAYAPESVYIIAHIYRDQLHDNVQAIAAFNTLATAYGQTAFPHKPAAATERRALAMRVDAVNSRRPLYRILDFFVRITGRRSYSFAAALAMISALVRLALAPLTIRQMRGARQMQALQPAVKQIQETHKSDPARQFEEIRKLHRDHGVDPNLAWILPLLQAPFFLAMYQAVQLYQYHPGNGFLWIGGKFAAAHPQFLALDLGLPDIPLLVLYAVSMFVMQRLLSQPDAAQAKAPIAVAWVMPILSCLWIGANHTASAFVLYWLISNIFAMGLHVYCDRVQEPSQPMAA